VGDFTSSGGFTGFSRRTMFHRYIYIFIDLFIDRGVSERRPTTMAFSWKYEENYTTFSRERFEPGAQCTRSHY
jgi:hypothetical protein